MELMPIEIKFPIWYNKDTEKQKYQRDPLYYTSNNQKNQGQQAGKEVVRMAVYRIFAEVSGEFVAVGGAPDWAGVQAIRKYWPESIVIRK